MHFTIEFGVLTSASKVLLNLLHLRAISATVEVSTTTATLGTHNFGLYL